MPLYAHDLACLHLRSSQPASVASTIAVGARVKSPYDSLPNRRQTSRDFVPWRFSDADRISAWRVSSCRRPRNLPNCRLMHRSKKGIPIGHTVGVKTLAAQGCGPGPLLESAGR